MMPPLQLETVSVASLVFVLSLVLTIVLTLSYLKSRRLSKLFWSLGMWAFTASALMTVAFALGTYSEPLATIYLYIVAILVELLAIGSMQLMSYGNMKLAYYAFCAITTAFMFYSLAVSSIPNLIANYALYGSPPALVVYASSAITIPASAILVIIAIKSYWTGKDYWNISIVAGVLIFALSGAIYINSFPSMQYVTEFIGIFLLWLGFFKRAN
ncbi:MAG: hypothetical protein KGI06_03470 [Candidatus Micrarchaeota archaeon]|nr:hypothetical protein [Candidatus Micrarchaeota archaeon]